MNRIIGFATRRILGRRPIRWVGISRITVIPKDWHSTEFWDVDVDIMLQDEGRTLKVWVARKETP
jgi:hypothetical protein